jgi:hypothetical protein
LLYRPSPKHCEPITAQKPGTKCPHWSAARAQELLDNSVPMGDKRVATSQGLAFVAQPTGDGTWHGYPESWDKIDAKIRARWKAEGLITGRDLRQWFRREDVGTAWKELNDVQ